jgi:integrase
MLQAMVKEADIDRIAVPGGYDVLDATALGQRLGLKRDTVLAYLSRRNFGRIPKPVYGKTRKEAAEKLTKALADRDMGLVFEGENRTLAAFLDGWLEGTVKGSVKDTTYESYERLIRYHDLRHTCATLLLSRGHHPKLVQELLGHASVALTLDRYSHVLPGMGDQTAAAMEAALS